jgi:hypothetical protein
MLNVPEILDTEGKEDQLFNSNHPSIMMYSCEFEDVRVDSIKVCTEDALAIINPCHLAKKGHFTESDTSLLPREKSIVV